MDNSNKKVMKSDRIGTLPDVVLHHILAFLDMKEVVQVSLLSSRWRYLWVSLPVINCSHLSWKKINRKSLFMNFVDKVLLLRDGSNIRKLQICSYYNDNDTKRLDEWIISTTRKHLQEIHLKLFPVSQTELPRAVFYSAITVLKLDFVDVRKRTRIKIPNLICSMTRLTTMILIFVTLPEGNSSGELFFSYLVLENLIIIECRHEHLQLFKISTPQLKTFVMRNDLHSKNEIVSSCRMELCAPSLQSLEVSCKNCGRSRCFQNYQMKNLSSLVSAKLHFNFVESMIQLLEDISCAKTIDISCIWFEDFHAWPNEVTSSFSNPRCLNVRAELIIFSFVIFALKKFPCIETLVLLADEVGEYVEDLPPCVNHLKFVEIGWLKGDEEDYRSLKYLLDNALVLEKLVIRMHKDSSSSERETFGKKILSLLRPSSRVAIFYYC